MNVTIKRAGGYDPRLGRDHPQNQDPTLEAHAHVVDTLTIPAGEGHSDYRFRWRCTCGRAGKWHAARVSSARNGGARHVAAMERGR
jgi:hypothetical protein